MQRVHVFEYAFDLFNLEWHSTLVKGPNEKVKPELARNGEWPLGAAAFQENLDKMRAIAAELPDMGDEGVGNHRLLIGRDDNAYMMKVCELEETYVSDMKGKQNPERVDMPGLKGGSTLTSTHCRRFGRPCVFIAVPTGMHHSWRTAEAAKMRASTAHSRLVGTTPPVQRHFTSGNPSTFLEVVSMMGNLDDQDLSDNDREGAEGGTSSAGDAGLDDDVEMA